MMELKPEFTVPGFFLRNAHFNELINLLIIWLQKKEKNPKKPYAKRTKLNHPFLPFNFV